VKQNQLYLVIGALVVIIVVLGGYVYHERTKPEGVQIQLDKNGLTVKKN
jgi:RsiW-degrading membrane proteinase PrsW (M82 family)